MSISDQLINSIKQSKIVAIFIHIRPDGDCIGSGFALKQILENMGKKCDIFCDGIVGKNFGFIKGINSINKQNFNTYDTSISVDVPCFSRLGCYAELYKSAKCKLNIDHHPTNDKFGDYNLIDGTRASVCEMVYELLVKMNVTITPDVANALYAGVATDTGCFMHASAGAVTHKIASELINCGANIGTINTVLFKNKSITQIELLKSVLNNFRLFCSNRVCISYLTKGNLIDANYHDTNDTVGLVDYVVGIDGVEIGVLITEDKQGICSVSMRSKGNVDVSKLAEYFGGGGHKNAAGCNIFGKAQSAVKKMQVAIEEVYAGVY